MRGKDLGYSRPDEPMGANPSTLRSIRMAWDERTRVDTAGQIWVEVSHLHIVLRTSISRARAFVARVPDRDFVTIEGVRHVRGWHVANRIALDIDQIAKLRRCDYLEFSEEHYEGIRGDPQTKVLRAKHLEALEGLSRKLKKERIRRLEITCDELTLEPLASRAHFAHVLARSLHPEFMDCVWNGVVVNPTTHDLLTLQGAMNDRDLLQLCATNGYSTEWHPPFEAALAVARA